MKPFDQYFKAKQYQLDPTEQPSFILQTIYHKNVAIQEIAQLQETDKNHIDPFVLDPLQFHDWKKNLVLDSIIVIENSLLMELHHAQDTLNFLNNEVNLDLFLSFFQKKTSYRCLSRSNSKIRHSFRKCLSSYRPLSRPRLRSASASRRLVKKLQTNFSENQDDYTWNFLQLKDNFEGNIYTTEIANAITRTSWYYNLYTHSQNETEPNLFSTLDVALPLGSFASFLVLNIPTYLTTTPMFSVCEYDQNDTSKKWLLQTNLEFQLNIIYLCNLFLINGNKNKNFHDSLRNSWYWKISSENTILIEVHSKF